MAAKSEPAWSFRPRHNQSKHPNNPGPGTYNGNKQKLNQTLPTFSISRGQRFRLNHRMGNPGPGQYNQTASPRSRGGDIGKGNRPALSQTLPTPGPGNYNPHRSQFEGPQFSMVGRTSKKQQGNNPGPGAYSATEAHIHKEPLYKFGTRKRSGSVDDKKPVPGPGKYETPSTLQTTSGKMGTDSRDSRINNSGVPGPGTYTHSPAFDKRAYSMRGRDLKPQKIENPGPGSYEPAPGFDKKTFSCGKEQRFLSFSPTKNQPGPGNYEEIKSHFNKAARAVFGTNKRENLFRIQENPGPGNYDAKHPHGSIQTYSMNGRYQKKVDNGNPGPGHYQWKQDTKRPLYNKFGNEVRQGPRDDKVRHAFPGPGNYESKPKNETPNWGFGSSGRLEDRNKPDIGPGTYEFTSLVGNVPKYSK